MRMKLLIILFGLFIIMNQNLQSQLYGGLGAGYIQPFGEFDEINKSALSYSVNLENRYYCRLWYGVRLDYSEFEAKDGLDSTIPHYNNILNITPQFRYNFLGLNCYDDVVFPYLQLGMIISSAGSSNNSSRLGLGALGGGGLSYGFNIFKTCFLVDLNASYSMPNILIKDNTRKEIHYLHLNLILNVKL